MILKNIDLKSGKISYNSFDVDENVAYERQIDKLDQDLLIISFTDNYLIDVCWLPDFNPNGRFICRIIKDEDWQNPILRKETRNFRYLEKNIQDSINLVEDLLKSKIELMTIKQSTFTNNNSNFHFDRSHFQDFFDEEKILDATSGSFYYSKRLENGFECEVNILAIDNFIALTLRHNDDKVFSIGFEGITKISLNEINDQCFFDLYKEDTTKPYRSFLIKPRVSLDVLIK